MMSLYTFENPVFAGYAFYASLLVFKMMIMSFLTGFKRITKKVFVNPEDALMAQTQVKLEGDEDVERVRRAHLNDLENIPVFLISGLVFIGTDPNVIFALMMFRIYTVARIIHTIVYAIYVVRQPARGIAFNVGVLANIAILVAIFVRCYQF